MRSLWTLDTRPRDTTKLITVTQPSTKLSILFIDGDIRIPKTLETNGQCVFEVRTCVAKEIGCKEEDLQFRKVGSHSVLWENYNYGVVMGYSNGKFINVDSDDVYGVNVSTPKFIQNQKEI
jgi:hypothetical protein